MDGVSRLRHVLKTKINQVPQLPGRKPVYQCDYFARWLLPWPLSADLKERKEIILS
jgi:hypothetical protein